MSKNCMMVSGIAALLVAVSSRAIDMATIINKLSENSDKIQSYSAWAQVRYHI